MDLPPRLILPQGCWGEKTQTLGHIQLFLHVHDFSTNKGTCTVFLRRDAFMSCILCLTDGHLPPKASKVRSNNQTRGPWSFQSLGHQPKFHKATESVHTKMRKAATLVRKEHTQLKVAFGEKLICKEFPEKEILIKCRKNRWASAVGRRRAAQVWRTYNLKKLRCMDPSFPRSRLFHRFRAVPTHSSRVVWGNLRALVLLGSFGSVKIGAGNNPSVQ